jgi:2-dehydropantoate 2-reductase
MRFVVIGAGAIGGVVGGRLAQSGHDVVLVARGEHGAEIQRSGLRIDSPSGSRTVNLAVVDRPSHIAYTSDDVVLLAVKSQDTVDALDDLALAADSSVPVVCLQNGVNNEREALRRFTDVYGVTVMCPTLHLEPGRVVAYSAPIAGVLDIGRYPHGVDNTAIAVANAFASSTFSSIPQPDIMRWKWAKLLNNLGNAIEAACGPAARTGAIADVVRNEALGVLGAAGIEYASPSEERERRGELVNPSPVDGEHRPGGSSWQSLARGGGRIETVFLNGEIVLLGRLHGVPTPANDALLALAQNLASAGTEPGSVDAKKLLAQLTS